MSAPMLPTWTADDIEDVVVDVLSDLGYPVIDCEAARTEIIQSLYQRLPGGSQGRRLPPVPELPEAQGRALLAVSRLMKEHGRPPSFQEVADMMGTCKSVPMFICTSCGKRVACPLRPGRPAASSSW